MKQKKMDLSAALCHIVQQYGAEVFRDHRRVYALLSDLAGGDAQAKERRRIKKALDSGAVDILLQGLGDPASGQLHRNEATARLIAETDMAQEIAAEVIRIIGDAVLGTQPTVSSKQQPTAPEQSATKAQNAGLQGNKRMIAICGAALLGAALLSVLVWLFLTLSWSGRQWIIGIGAGAALTGLLIGLSCWLEDALCNEKCQTITVGVLVLLVGNVVLRAVLPDAGYGLIFRILCLWLFAGSVANGVLTRTEYEESYTLPNVAAALCSGFLFFLWPGDFSWTVWQWIIGIGGGLVLTGLTVFLAWVLDELGPEMHQTLSVLLLLYTIINLVLLLKFSSSYLIIAMCLLAMLALGAVINTFLSFGEDSTVLGVLNVLLALLNGGIFLFVCIGSFEQLMHLAEPLLKKLGAGAN